MAKRYFNFSKDGLVERVTGRGRVDEAFVTYDPTIANQGGMTIIADEGVISGTYTTNVLCQGNADITGPVVVFGNLMIVGNLGGADGHGIRVYGNFYSDSIQLIPSTGTLAQENIRVYGDWFFNDDITIRSYGGYPAQVDVYGSLIGAHYFIVAGGSGSNGGSLTIHGDLIAEEVDLSGVDGEELAGTNATDGGQLQVYGNVVIGGDLDMAGGFQNYGSAAGGTGGNVEITGAARIGSDIFMRGGDALSGSGGGGGSVLVEGDLSVYDELELFGGDSTAGNAGTGGNLIVRGNLTHMDHNEEGTKIYGGNSTLAAGGSGGLVEVYGSANVYSLMLYGGNGDTLDGGGGTATFEGGINAEYVNMLDGSGAGTTPTNSVELVLGGTSHIYSLEMPDRVDSKIYTAQNTLATARFGTMTPKNSLNEHDGSPVGPILNPEEKVFYTSNSGQWYEMSGTLITAP